MEFESLHALEILHLTNCVRLEKVPMSFAKLASLKELSLKGCENLMDLPVDFGNLHALELLDLTNCGRLEKVPKSFVNLESLKRLALERCENLMELLVEFGNLHALESLRYGGLCEFVEGSGLIRLVFNYDETVVQ